MKKRKKKLIWIILAVLIVPSLTYGVYISQKEGFDRWRRIKEKLKERQKQGLDTDVGVTDLDAEDIDAYYRMELKDKFVKAVLDVEKKLDRLLKGKVEKKVRKEFLKPQEIKLDYRSPFGLNADLGDVKKTTQFSYDKDSFKTELKKRLPLAFNAGVRWFKIQDYFKDHLAYKEIKGIKDFYYQDERIKMLFNHGLVPIISLGPERKPLNEIEVYDKYLPIPFENFKKYVNTVVERFNGDGNYDIPGLPKPVDYWIIGKEIDLLQDMLKKKKMSYCTPEDYYLLCKSTFEEIKKIHPNGNLVVSFALCMSDEIGSDSFLYRFLEAGGSDVFDVIELYDYNQDTRTIFRRLEHIERLVGKDKEIWIGGIFLENKKYLGKKMSNACLLIV